MRVMQHAFAGTLIGLACAPASAATQQEILQENARAVVFLEVQNADGGVLETGTGFLISQDGYVLTVAHIDVEPDEKLWARIGERAGTAFPLDFREEDSASDVALWQFPQSPTCRSSVTLASARMETLQPVMAVGFPGTQGLTPSALTINNLTAARGFAGTDGFLEMGNSGGPVFNQDGRVVAIVHGGGLPGTESNQIIPITRALPLLQKWGVNAGIDAPVAFDDACYATCRAPEHGIETWKTTEVWSRQSGWLGGGNTQTGVCTGLAGAIQVERGAEAVEITGMGENSKKDVFGRVEYQYSCTGLIHFGPIYASQRSPACGTWN